MTLILNDFAGHPFTLDLANALTDIGATVEYLYCSDNVAPHADFDCSGAGVRALGTGGSFDKYNVVRRLVGESVYGLRSAWRVIRTRPSDVIVTNMPIVSALVVWAACLIARSRRVLWLQDIQSGLARKSLGGTSRVARIAEMLEGLAMRSAHRVISISEPLRQGAVQMGVKRSRIAMLPNWPVLGRLPICERDNAWANEQNLDPARPRFVYTGTLARKHSPELLYELAARTPHADVVVVSEGEGASWLASRIAERPLDNLILLPYQPFERLSEVLGSADALVALLDSEAAIYSVPSKILSYLCAGRPILASMPADNPAAVMITASAGAGRVTQPGDAAEFATAAGELLADRDLASEMGANGRAFAEESFERNAVVERFLGAAGITRYSNRGE